MKMTITANRLQRWQHGWREFLLIVVATLLGFVAFELVEAALQDNLSIEAAKSMGIVGFVVAAVSCCGYVLFNRGTPIRSGRGKGILLLLILFALLTLVVAALRLSGADPVFSSPSFTP